MMGRPTQPAALKLIKGENRTERLNPNEPKPKAKVPNCPRWMPDEGKKAWKALVPKLASYGMLTDVDEHAMQMYCSTYARWRAAEEEVDALERLSVKMGDKGYVQQSPCVVVAQKYFAQLKGMMAEFGMTPASRTRVQAAKDDVDEFSEFW